jgi:hypothetical protein
LNEPALYIAPQSPTNGGTPLFPQWIKGSYNNNPPTRGTFNAGATIDPPPAGSTLAAKYTGGFIWDVSKLGLGPGSHAAVFRFTTATGIGPSGASPSSSCVIM